VRYVAELRVAVPGDSVLRCAIYLPRPTARHPLVILQPPPSFHAEGAPHAVQPFLDRDMAVLIPEDELQAGPASDDAFLALRWYVERQSWVMTNAIACVDCRPQSPPSGELLAQSPLGPAEVVLFSDAEVKDADDVAPLLPHRISAAPQPRITVFCDAPPEGALAVPGGSDRVEVRGVPGLRGALAREPALVLRRAADFLARRLPRADFRCLLGRTTLTEREAADFNEGMARAGRNRRMLCEALRRVRGPRLHTAVTLIGCLEDYDLARAKARLLVGRVSAAWKNRQEFPWCRNVPLSVFEHFVVNPRAQDDPLVGWDNRYDAYLHELVKYCRTTEEASNALRAWMKDEAEAPEPAAGYPSSSLLHCAHSGCGAFSAAFTALGRDLGLAVRPAMTVWPTAGTGHAWNEIWSAELGVWHAFDTSDFAKDYRTPWMARMPKAAIYCPTGNRGGWLAWREHRWEAMTNTIGMFYPSGEVIVRVLDREGNPVAGRRVLAQCWLRRQALGDAPLEGRPALATVAVAVTGGDGVAALRLGESAEWPYRVCLAGGAGTDWAWVAVRRGETCETALRVGTARPYDMDAPPQRVPWALMGSMR
jgi:hypothetical protein